MSTYRSQANRLAALGYGRGTHACILVAHHLGRRIQYALPVVLLRFLSHEQSLLREYTRVNWTSFVLGVCVVGLEVGMLYTYRVGWPVNTASVVQAAFLAVSLLVVSAILFHEPITANKVIGIVICMVGLYFLNK